MTGLRSALGFLTILPVAPRDAGGLASARAWFPVVGLLLGAVLAGVELLLHAGYPLFTQEYRQFPPLLSAAILTAAMIALTRGLHLDGFMDCCDAFLGGFTRERRLEILRDSHVGAFAVVGVVGLLLLKFGALAALAPSGRIWLLLVVPCLSRWAMLMMLELFPYARREGIGTPFLPEGGRWQLMGGLLVAVAVTVAFAGPVGLALLLAASLIAWLLGAWASKLIGGVTGDVYGAANETAEAALLVVAAILFHFVSDSVLSPIFPIPD